MSLQVWLPLNGSLENLGFSDTSQISTTNLTFSDNGKIGKCLTGYTGYFNIPSMTGKKQLSVAYWVRINTATATNWLDAFRWHSTDGSTSYSSRNEFYNDCTNTGFWFKGGSISGKATTVGEWHHHAFTIDYEAGIALFYIDGIPKGSSSAVDTTHYLTGNFMIGENGLDTSHNDVRIYDHILSAKEVKELSKGLVAHYPLNDFSINSNETIIYDCSGYGRNCTISDNLPVVNSDTPRYSSCMFFENGTVNYAYHDGFQAPSDAITMNFWFRSNGKIGYRNYHEFFGIGGRYFENSMNADGQYRNGFYVNGTRYCSDYGNTNLLTDLKWHMLSATYDGSAIKRYIDSELVNTTNVSGVLSNSPMQMNIGRLNSTEPYAVNEIYLSDLRIYCTALSAEDIKALYETSVSIDDKGNFHSYEISEV